MRSFLFAACIVSLLYSGVGMAINQFAASNGSKVTQWASYLTKKAATKTAKAVATLTLIGGAVCGGLTGCEPGMQMGKDIVSAEDAVGVTASAPHHVKIGLLYEHEFPSSYNGVELAVMQANLTGGIDGKYVKLIPHKIYARGKGDVVNAAENLIIHDEVVAIIGPNSSLTEFVDEVVAIYNVPLVPIAFSSATLTRVSENVFLSAFTVRFQGKVMAEHGINNLGAKSAAVLFWHGDAYSQGLAEAFRDNFTMMGGNIVAYGDYTYETFLGHTHEEEDAHKEFAERLHDSGMVDKILAGQPDVIFIPGFSEILQVAETLREAGEDAIFLGGDGWETADIHEEHGHHEHDHEVEEVDGELHVIHDHVLEGSYYASHFNPANNPEFTQAYHDAYGMEPDSYAALGHTAGDIVIQAARRAGKNLNRTNLRYQIEATSNYVGATNIDRFDDMRHPVKSVVIFRIKDGEIVLFDTIDPQN